MRLIPKPLAGEFAPYASMYIDLLPDDGKVLDHMEASLSELEGLLAGLSESALTSPCAEGEWTIKEILLHIIDDERIYAYRALRFARNDKTELPSFEQDDYVAVSHANERSLASLLDEYRTVRMATLSLFEHLPVTAFEQAGVANSHLMSVRAAAYHIAGHELHHFQSIRNNYRATLNKI